jgi:septal ring factor EnvC (AmiA/AmiB activator)
VQDPLFWLLLSFLLVAVSLTAVLAAAFPAFLELGRAARSAEKLLDTLNREIPRTLAALRRTGGDITDLTDELEASFKSARGIIQQTEKGLKQTHRQIQQVQHRSRSTWTGIQAAWQTFHKKPQRKTLRRDRPRSQRHR